MTGRAVAYSGERVQLYNELGECDGFSTDNFHSLPDGADTFAASIYNPADTGFYYASNSELSGTGGVGSLKFDAKGNVIGYKRTLTNTQRNCGGGKTSWGSWVSCEERSGYTTRDGGVTTCWQTDPSDTITSRRTQLVDGDEKYESTVEVPNMIGGTYPVFVTTVDSGTGTVQRFTPNAAGKACFDKTSNADKWCTIENGTRDYLLLSSTDCPGTGTFSWTTNKGAAATNANLGEFLSCLVHPFSSNSFLTPPNRLPRRRGNRRRRPDCLLREQGLQAHARPRHGGRDLRMQLNVVRRVQQLPRPDPDDRRRHQ